jgi:hypothetical protein
MQATKPTQQSSAAPFSNVRPRQTVDYMLATLQSTLASFSAMADAKANIMITICSVALTVGLTQRPDRLMEWPLMLLTISAFIALFLSVLAVLPSGRYPRNPDGTIEPRPRGFNPLYFGHFAHMPQDRFAAEVGRLLADDARIYEAIANDLWNQGVVLAHRKYRYLRWAYQVLLLGAFSTGIVSIWIWMR